MNVEVPVFYGRGGGIGVSARHSGVPGPLAEVLAGLEAQGVFCRMIKVDVASHSPQMDPLREELVAGLAGG